MRTTSPRVFAMATAAAALLVLPFAATRPTPSLSESTKFGETSEFTTGSFATHLYATSTETSAVWVSTTATPSLATNASYHCITLNGLQGCPVGYPGGYTMLPYFQTADVSKHTSNPYGCTTTTTSTTTMNRGSRRRSTTNTISNATRSDSSAAATPRTMTFNERFDVGSHEDTSNESRWRRFRREPLRLPDQFMARFLNTLMYLAEVITADVISAFLFGRWRPRYYQRAKKNRLDRKRRRRYRRVMMNASDLGNMIWDACVRLQDTLCPIQDDLPSPTYQMVSNVQLTEYPATLSTFADVPTSEIVAIVASAGSSALDSIASLSAPTSAFLDLPIPASNEAQVGLTTTDERPAVSAYVPRLVGAPEMSQDALCYPGISLPDIGVDIVLPSAVSRRSPLLLEAALPTTRPSLLLTAALNGCAMSMVNSLVRYTNAERSVNTPLEEFGGPVDDADDTPPAPFFVSECYTPESTCYVSAHGVAYTTITKSYVHRVNFRTGPGAPDDTPTTTQTGDVSDILFPASNAQLRCKWYRECIQTASSEYYRSAVEAVFVARFIPDETDMLVLTDLVTRHL